LIGLPVIKIMPDHRSWSPTRGWRAVLDRWVVEASSAFALASPTTRAFVLRVELRKR